MMGIDRLLDGRRLLLRADAGLTTGTGHLMRCLALAQAWLDLGGKARWLLADAPEPLIARIEAEGIEVARVGPGPGGGPDPVPLWKALTVDRSAIAIVDGLDFREPFLAYLGPDARRVLLVDDMALLSSYPVGWVLNQNAHADRAAYPAGATCGFLLGLRYALLRREFRTPVVRRDVPERAGRLLVTFGGSDPTGMTLRTIRAVRRIAAGDRGELEVRVIVGAANRDGSAINAEAGLANDGPDLAFDVRHAVDDMPAQIAWADLAVTSGGSTVWELARYGCPALVVETVPAEGLLVQGLAAVGLDDRLGPAATLDEQELAHRIAARIEDRQWRAEMHERGKRLVDGDGARRVALELAGMATEG